MSKQHSFSKQTSKFSGNSNEEEQTQKDLTDKNKAKDNKKTTQTRFLPLWWFEPFVHKDDKHSSEEEKF